MEAPGSAIATEENRSSMEYEDAKSYHVSDVNLHAAGEKKPTEPAQDVHLPVTKEFDGAADEMDQSHSQSIPEIGPHEIYWNWQFILVFISISLGFHAAFLGTLTTWGGGQTILPAELLLQPLRSTLNPLNVTAINTGLDLKAITAGLDFSKMATGINTTRIEEGLDPNTIFWGIVHTNLRDVMSGINITEIARGLQFRDILQGVNSSQIARSIHFKELISGLNLREFIPDLYYGVPTAIKELEGGLWIYPTMIFSQVLSSIFFGRLSDFVGRRWIFLFGNLVSFVAFLASGRTFGSVNLTGLSVLIGIGTGIQIMGPWLAVAELVPIRHRFTVTGICLSMLAPLVILHVAISTAFLKNNIIEGWRWPYYINAIFSFASLIGLFVAYHPPTYRQLHDHPTDDPPVKDWLGLLAFTTAIGLVTFSLGWGKLIWAWSSPQVISVLTLSCVALVGFIAYQYIFGNDHAAYPAYLMRNSTHLSQMIIGGVHSFIWVFGPLAQFVIFATVTPRFGMKGAWESTWSAGQLAGFIFASILLAKPKHLKTQLVIAALFGMIFFPTLRVDVRVDQYRWTMAFLFLSGMGHGYMTIITYVTAPMTAHKRDLGFCVGLLSALRGLVFSIIRTLFVTLYINQIMGNIQRTLLPAFGKAGPVPSSLRQLLEGLGNLQAGGSLGELLQVTVVRQMINAVVVVFAKSWQFMICIAMIYFGAVLIYTIFSPRTDSYLSKQISVRLNNQGILRLRPGKIISPDQKL